MPATLRGNPAGAVAWDVTGVSRGRFGIGLAGAESHQRMLADFSVLIVKSVGFLRAADLTGGDSGFLGRAEQWVPSTIKIAISGDPDERARNQCGSH
jgi:hypothetical protein